MKNMIKVSDRFMWDLYGLFQKTAKIRDVLSAPRYAKVDVLFGLDNPVFRKYKNELGAKRFANLVYYLKKNNYIRAENVKGKQAFLMGKKGISKAFKASFHTGKSKKREDGKWIMIIFDIPASHRKARALLMSVLGNLGYKLFQHSVWVTPYDVSEKTEKALQFYALDRYVKTFLIEKL